MKKSFVKLIIFLFTLLLMGILGGLYSLVFAGVAGGTGIIIAPQSNFEFAGRIVCPGGSQPQYINHPVAASGTSYLINCISRDGKVIEEIGSKAVPTVIGLYFLLCFIPTYIPGAILLGFFLSRRFFKFLDEDTAPASSE